MRCTGKEEFLGECPSLGLSVEGCRRRQDAGVRCDVTPPPKESAAAAEPQGRSCGLRKLVEGDGKRRRSQGEDSLLRLACSFGSEFVEESRKQKHLRDLLLC